MILDPNNKTPAEKLIIASTTHATTERVTGVVSCSLTHNKKPVNRKKAMATRVRRLLWLNIVLVFVLAICVRAVLLTKATSHLVISVAMTLVTRCYSDCDQLFPIHREKANRKGLDFQQVSVRRAVCPRRLTISPRTRGLWRNVSGRTSSAIIESPAMRQAPSAE